MKRSPKQNVGKRIAARDPRKGVATAHNSKRIEASEFRNIEVWIVGENGAFHAIANVLVRQGGMVLEIAGGKGIDALLPGKLAAGVYNAIEDRPPPGVQPIRARWARIGRRYVGTWLEDGKDHLFSFTLPE